ncbi:MAG: sensor histidine kinase [Bacteroidetes bacterium]|nr:sensor histidine kinase [Bacteroidota bacterium]
MKNALKKLIDLGVQPHYQPWEIYLTRKLNSITLIAIVNMLLGILFFEITGYTQFIFECICSLIVLPFVIVLNVYRNYIWAAYWFYIFGYIFFIPMNLKMGLQSYIILFYFPVLISMVQLLGKKETLKHLIILSVFCLLSVIFITIGYKYDIYKVVLSADVINNMFIFNIILSFLTTLSFMIIMVYESITQENHIKSILKEKEILLAEVFHRVKNNMNIVTSLLNLKKGMSDSKEVQDALEDCRNRVFSMALVHQNIFNSKNIVGLNFKDYVKNLTSEIAKSLGEEEKFEIVLETEDVSLDLSNAIPCGLILNELITNSFKYAQQADKKLMVGVKLKKVNGRVELEVRDNGLGIPENSTKNHNSLGLELIKSLSEQINGAYSFSNENGLVFKLSFVSQ